MVHCSRDQICHHAVTYQLVPHGYQSMNTDAKEINNNERQLNNDAPLDCEHLDKKSRK
jgi:hypothetical protein